jgi:hypothetical protein
MVHEPQEAWQSASEQVSQERYHLKVLQLPVISVGAGGVAACGALKIAASRMLSAAGADVSGRTAARATSAAENPTSKAAQMTILFNMIYPLVSEIPAPIDVSP